MGRRKSYRDFQLEILLYCPLKMKNIVTPPSKVTEWYKFMNMIIAGKSPIAQLIFDKDSERTQRKRTVSSINGAGKTGQPHAKK